MMAATRWGGRKKERLVHDGRDEVADSPVLLRGCLAVDAELGDLEVLGAVLTEGHADRLLQVRVACRLQPVQRRDGDGRGVAQHLGHAAVVYVSVLHHRFLLFHA
jgi:hypothetical protein